MDFSESIALADPEERNSDIEQKVQDEDWSEIVVDQLQSGGWVDNAYVERFEIVNETAQSVFATVTVVFCESIPTGCKEINREQQMTVYYRLEIDKASGGCELTCYNCDESDDGESEPYYPDDYN
jgi:hypothetical protein